MDTVYKNVPGWFVLLQDHVFTETPLEFLSHVDELQQHVC